MIFNVHRHLLGVYLFSAFVILALMAWIQLPQICPRQHAKSHDLGKSTNDYDYQKDLEIQQQTLAEIALDSANQSEPQVKVLCWVMTSPSMLLTRGSAVNRTWLKRCDRQLFMSSETYDGDSRVIKVTGEEGRDRLPNKTMQAFKYIFDHHLNDSDWFMKADDDTYVVVENLKHVLAQHSPSDPIYLGHLFRPFVTQGYQSGGAGYVLSREALRRFGVDGYGRSDVCGIATTDEDVELGRCMEKLGVRTESSLDPKGRSRFHAYHPSVHIGGLPLSKYDFYDANGGKQVRGWVSGLHAGRAELALLGPAPRLQVSKKRQFLICPSDGHPCRLAMHFGILAWALASAIDPDTSPMRVQD